MKLHKIAILIICFALTSIFIYLRPSSKAVEKKVPLSQVLSELEGWRSSGLIELDPRIVKSLELDDYINQSYSNGKDTISLYIGYYLTTKKVGAAHDPLVCFHGQGWVVSDTKKGKIILNPKPRYSLSYSSMIAQRRSQKELIIYWFQSYDKTNPDTLSQKTNSLWGKLCKAREDNAFVRISTPVGEKSLSESRKTIFKFMRNFHPIFLNYVRGQGLTDSLNV
jgi:EpsI family protein